MQRGMQEGTVTGQMLSQLWALGTHGARVQTSLEEFREAFYKGGPLGGRRGTWQVGRLSPRESSPCRLLLYRAGRVTHDDNGPQLFFLPRAGATVISSSRLGSVGGQGVGIEARL